MFYFLAIVLAFCSIVYELLMGQVLSAFLGNTVLRYSVTIGLYMCFKGFGALCAHERLNRNALKSLQSIELALTIIGTASVPLLFVLDALVASGWIFSITAHLLIALIGFLTGFELPLMLHVLQSAKSRSEGVIIGMDYLGAFIGTIAFAFYFYPTLGIVRTALLIATLNALAGVVLGLLSVRQHAETSRASYPLLFYQGAILAALVGGMFYAQPLQALCLNLYLRHGGGTL